MGGNGLVGGGNQTCRALRRKQRRGDALRKGEWVSRGHTVGRKLNDDGER